MCVVLAVFALYAGVLRLMPFHDDAVLMPAINNRTLLSIFENRPFGDGHHRPVSYVPWLLTRDLFGWFVPAVLHFWNLLAHTLDTAMIGSLAGRLCPGARAQKRAAQLAAMLAFGVAPLSYEAVLWASALVHPWMVMFGLGALHSWLDYQRRRRAGMLALCALFLSAACLSHEIGFVFSVLIVLIALYQRNQRKVPWAAFGLLAGGIGYALLYRFWLITKWADPAANAYAAGIGERLASAAWQAQSLLALPVHALRAAGIAPSEALAVPALLTLAVVIIGAALGWAWRAGRLRAAVFALAFWLVCAAPSALLLTQDYVWTSPRMSYLPALGAALCAAMLAATLRPAAIRKLAWVIALAGSVWHADYIATRLVETSRLTPALRLIDEDLRRTDSADRLLLINSSFTNLALKPAFWIGREGMPFWEHGNTDENGPFWAWPASVSGVVRETRNVQHEPSLSDRDPELSGGAHLFTLGANGRFRYALMGVRIDDAGLASFAAQSSLVYRFEYDMPGVRLLRLAWLRQDNPAGRAGPDVARFDSGLVLRAARAWRCGAHAYASLTWVWPDAVSPRPLAVFAHGYRGAGQVLVADADPAGGLWPLQRLPAGRALTELREMPIDALAPPDTLHFGVYLRENGQRLHARRADDAGWDGEEVVIPVSPQPDAASRLESAVCQ